MMLDVDDIKQIEEWTNLQLSEVIYDTERDGYPKNGTTTFGDKVMNRNDLIFLIEDYDGNKFGEYLHEKFLISRLK